MAPLETRSDCVAENRQPVTYRVTKKAKVEKAAPIANFLPDLARAEPYRQGCRQFPEFTLLSSIPDLCIIF